MKNSMYRLLFVLCLFVGVSCSQNNQEGENAETSTEIETPTAEDEDTASTSNEVPSSLQQH